MLSWTAATSSTSSASSNDPRPASAYPQPEDTISDATALQKDGFAGIQQLAHDTNLLFYGSEEAQEGRDAYKEKRKPDFSQFPKRS